MILVAIHTTSQEGPDVFSYTPYFIDLAHMSKMTVTEACTGYVKPTTSLGSNTQSLTLIVKIYISNLLHFTSLITSPQGRYSFTLRKTSRQELYTKERRIERQLADSTIIQIPQLFSLDFRSCYGFRFQVSNLVEISWWNLGSHHFHDVLLNL